MWITMPQQQQRGVQFRPQHALGDAPAEAVRDRAAQDHEQAVVALPEGAEYPASRVEDDGRPVPEPRPAAEPGAELVGDERGRDAEATVPQDGAARFNAND